MARNRKTFARAIRRPLVGISCAALAIAASPLMAGVKDGVDAWSAGDYDRAVTEWQGPAAKGDPDALFNLAQAYRLGRGVEADIDRARALYAEAARKGHIKAADNYGLLLFQQGDHEAAMPLIRDAADRGDPRAQYILGLAHFNADHAAKDWVRAYALMTLSRAQGLPQANDALAQMDRYVPEAHKSQAQALARMLESEASRRRAADLAAAELGRPEAGGPARITNDPVASTSRAGSESDPAGAASSAIRRRSEPVLVASAGSETSRPEAARGAPASRPGTVDRPVRMAEATIAPRQAARQPARTRGEWRVQLGAFGVPGNAERLWSKLAAHPALEGMERDLVPAGRVMKLQAVGFATRSDARAACAALKRQGQACIVASPRS